jgi:hypothetical protein
MRISLRHINAGIAIETKEILNAGAARWPVERYCDRSCKSSLWAREEGAGL